MRKLSYIFIGFILIVTLPLVIIFFYNYVSNNFHVVVKNQIYRSAQPNLNEWNWYLHHYHIKSILNLRGKNQQYAWYIVEVKFARDHHIKHYDIGLSAYILPSERQLQKIMHIILSAPKPLLIHCQGGADRTSFVSSIAIILLTQHRDFADQISWKYNVFSENSIGHLMMRKYIFWLQHEGLSSNKINFIQWSKNDFSPYHFRLMKKDKIINELAR